MKKLTFLLLVCILAVASFVLVSCGDVTVEDVAGTYEGENLKGSIDYGSVKIELNEKNLTEYTLDLNADGTYKRHLTVSVNNQVVGEEDGEGTWTLEEGTVTLFFEEDGEEKTEKLQYDGGKLTFDTVEEKDGIEVRVKGTMKKT